MNYPRLFKNIYAVDDNGASFLNIDCNGMGPLADCLSCEVTEEKNGVFTLSMEYPVGGLHWLDIDIGRTIVCKPNQFTREQPFMIKKISKAMGGKIKVNADHIIYDASGIMVTGFNAGNSVLFKQHVASNAVDCPFVFGSDISKAGTYSGVYKAPRNLRSLLFEGKDSFLGLYGGEFSFDRLSIYAHQSRGADRGVSVRYGKNLTALTQTRTAREFATACYPYWYEKDKGYVELTEKVLYYGAIDYSDIYKTIPLDLTDEFEEAPTQSQLREAATAWINANWQSAPPYNIKLSFVELSKTAEYADIAAAEEVQLCDTITVIHPEFNISAKMQVIKTVYDVSKDRYTSVEVGDPIDTLADTILKLTGGKK